VSRSRLPGQQRPRARAVLGLLAGALVLSGCSRSDLNLGFPEPVTEQADRTSALWQGSIAAALIVGVIVSAMILFAAFRYRKRSDELPAQVRYNLPIEVLYTAVPFVIIAVLFYYTTITQNFVNELTPQDEGGAQVQIGVVGFQWNWTFRYDDEGVQTTGVPGQEALLVLPTDTTVRFTETSPDVIHSFWVPAFLFKRDVIPGRANTFEVTINKAGEYVGRCAELCGEKHSAMNFRVRAVPMNEYRSYVAGLKADPANAIVSEVGTGAVAPPEIEANTPGSSE